MAGSNRIRGNALILSFGTPATDHRADVTAVRVTNEDADADVITFADAAEGNTKRYLLNITAVQSTDPDSLWSYIWDHTGDEVAFTYAPHGNAAPTPAQPHITGLATVGPRPEIGGEASTSRTNAFTFETQWEITGVPALDRGAGA